MPARASPERAGEAFEHVPPVPDFDDGRRPGLARELAFADRQPPEAQPQPLELVDGLRQPQTVTATVTPQVDAGVRPAIEQHVHYHLHLADSRDPARVVAAEVEP